MVKRAAFWVISYPIRTPKNTVFGWGGRGGSILMLMFKLWFALCCKIITNLLYFPSENNICTSARKGSDETFFGLLKSYTIVVLSGWEDPIRINRIRV